MTFKLHPSPLVRVRVRVVEKVGWSRYYRVMYIEDNKREKGEKERTNKREEEWSNEAW